MTVFIDPDASARGLREMLYAGNLVVLTRLQAVSDLVEHTRQQLTELFRPHDPEHAHEHFEPAEMARMLGAWKPAFIHSDAAKKLTRAIITEAGLPDQQTHYDVPRPRTSFPVGHLTTGVAFAFPWHRDAWYSAPPQQLNWWMPVYPVRPDNSMAFDLNYFAKSVPNDSETFDYYEINSRRLTTAAQVTKVLRRYRRLRRRRVANVQRLAEKQGRIYHMASPMALARDLSIRLLGAKRVLARQRWIHDWKI